MWCLVGAKIESQFQGQKFGRSGYNRRAGYNDGWNSSSHQPDKNIGNCFVAEVNVSAIVKHVSNKNENRIVWMLDSGCSNHIINDDSLFENFSILNEPISVKLGDGRTLFATKIGNVRTSFKVDREFIPVDIQMVLFVKGMGSNLLSSGKIADKNTIIVVT